MEDQQLNVGELYTAKVGGKWVEVKLLEVSKAGFVCINRETGRACTLKKASSLKPVTFDPKTASADKKEKLLTRLRDRRENWVNKIGLLDQKILDLENATNETAIDEIVESEAGNSEVKTEPEEVDDPFGDDTPEVEAISVGSVSNGKSNKRRR